jgi:MFS family permease
VLGPLAAYALLSRLGESESTYQTLFVMACVPALLSVLVLTRIKDRPGVPHARESVRANWQQLSPAFKRFLVPAGVFALAYFSLGFILLKAHAMGFGVADMVLLYALFNASCVVTAPLIGRLGDRIGRGTIVMLGYGVYAALNVWLAVLSRPWEIIAVFALYGVFYAIDESQSKALIADVEPERRATAVGVYNFVTGVLYLPASLGAGLVWSVAPALVFGAASTLSVVAIVLFVVMRPVGKLQRYPA